MPVLALTEDNLSRIGEAPGNEEKERRLVEKMQKLSGLLEQVDALMQEDTESQPSTRQARQAQQSRQAPSASNGPPQRPDTASMPAAPKGEAPKPPGTGRSDFSTCSVRELSGLPANAGIDLVQYHGSQSHTAGIQRLRKVSNARAAQSSIGNLLGGD